MKELSDSLIYLPVIYHSRAIYQNYDKIFVDFKLLTIIRNLYIILNKTQLGLRYLSKGGK